MSLSKLAVRRLTKLADYMETVPRSQFDMRNWVAHKGDDSNITAYHDISDPDDIPGVMVECGMTACALGHAAMIPAFRKAGLVLKITRTTTVAYPATKSGAEEDKAAQEFFDIGADQSDELFRDDDIKTPKQWAAHCRKFLKAQA